MLAGAEELVRELGLEKSIEVKLHGGKHSLCEQSSSSDAAANLGIRRKCAV